MLSVSDLFPADRAWSLLFWSEWWASKPRGPPISGSRNPGVTGECDHDLLLQGCWAQALLSAALPQPILSLF